MVKSAFVTVGHFADPIAAELARAKLESAGIDSLLADQLTVALDWQLTNALGGIRLQVATPEGESALAVLRDEAAVISPGNATGSTDEFTPPNPREKLAARAATCALFGWLFPPFQLYASWLICRVLIAPEALRINVRRQFRYAVTANFVWLAVAPAALALSWGYW